MRACLGCARCSYLSFSRVNADCSWFYTCDLTRLHTRFAAQAGYQTFDLTAGFEAFGKFPTRKVRVRCRVGLGLTRILTHP